MLQTIEIMVNKTASYYAVAQIIKALISWPPSTLNMLGRTSNEREGCGGENKRVRRWLSDNTALVGHAIVLLGVRWSTFSPFFTVDFSEVGRQATIAACSPAAMDGWSSSRAPST